MLMNIRTLKPDEVDVFRELRLRALADSPNSFCETLQEAAAQPISYWQKLTESVTQPDGQVMFLAQQEENITGFVFGLLDHSDQQMSHIGGMWVDPEFRSQGIGYALVTAIVQWSALKKHHRVELWVTEDNTQAIKLYEKAGFIATGQRKVFPPDPTLQIIQMSLKLEH